MKAQLDWQPAMASEHCGPCTPNAELSQALALDARFFQVGKESTYSAVN